MASALQGLAEVTGKATITQTEPEAGTALRKVFGYREQDPRLAAITDHPRLAAWMADLLGPDAQCFQDMALLKPARVGSEKPWHQDAAYFDVLPADGVAGVWLALDPATVDNGCMQV